MWSGGAAPIFGAMTARVLEAVPNFSVGGAGPVLERIVKAMQEAGATVLDWSADADHNRAVVTLIGTPDVVENAAVAGVAVAVRDIDLRGHRGVHPRIGAADVVPFVPLAGLSMADARASARRVGRRIAAELRVPVFYYGAAAEPPGRPLAELRRGGFEGMTAAWPAGRTPDELPPDWVEPGAHPTAGACCVGARAVLLAWNVNVEGITRAQAALIARGIRETTGGFHGLRALALELPSRGLVQISMNLEDVSATPPMTVLRRIEELLAPLGGRVVETEVIGMMPDELVLGAAAERLRLRAPDAQRLLTKGVATYLQTHVQ